MTLRMDIFEPVKIKTLLEQSVPVLQLSLNAIDIPDYSWFGAANQHTGIERKQATELVSEMSVMEEILRKYMTTTDELALLIEGFMSPHRDGIATYRLLGGYKLGKEILFKQSYAQIMAWLWQLDKAGVTVYFTPCLEATAASLVAFYKNSQKEEHRTLRRYVKQRVDVWKPNPQVQAVLNIPNAGIGEKRAVALVERFECLYNIINAEPAELVEVDGIGKGIVKKLFKAVGREE